MNPKKLFRAMLAVSLIASTLCLLSCRADERSDAWVLLKESSTNDGLSVYIESEFTYNEESHSGVMTYYSADGKVLGTETISYDDGLRETSREAVYSGDEGGTRHERAYDDQGRVSEMRRYSIRAEGSILTAIDSFEYDESGELRHWTLRSPDGTVASEEYYENGQLTRKVGYEDDGTVNWEEENSYDSQGRPLESVRTVYQPHSRVYSYSDDGLSGTMTFLDEDKSVQYIEYLEFNETGDLIGATKDGGGSYTEHSYSYDDDGNRISWSSSTSYQRIYDASSYDENGNLLNSRNVQFHRDGEVVQSAKSYDYLNLSTGEIVYGGDPLELYAKPFEDLGATFESVGSGVWSGYDGKCTVNLSITMGDIAIDHYRGIYGGTLQASLQVGDSFIEGFDVSTAPGKYAHVKAEGDDIRVTGFLYGGGGENVDILLTRKISTNDFGSFADLSTTKL